MRFTNYKNDLETKHSYHAIIMQMCMMNIFVVCFVHATCSRLIQPVVVYIKWYMMWCLKRYALQGTYRFWLIHHFSNLAIICHPVDMFHMELVCTFHVCFCTHASSHDRRQNTMCDHVHDHRHNLFGKVQVLNPWYCSTIFLWVQGSIPWPWSPVFGMWCPSPMSYRLHTKSFCAISYVGSTQMNYFLGSK